MDLPGPLDPRCAVACHEGSRTKTKLGARCLVPSLPAHTSGAAFCVTTSVRGSTMTHLAASYKSPTRGTNDVVVSSGNGDIIGCTAGMPQVG